VIAVAGAASVEVRMRILGAALIEIEQLMGEFNVYSTFFIVLALLVLIIFKYYDGKYKTTPNI